MDAVKVLLLLILVFIIASLVATGIHYQSQGNTYIVKKVNGYGEQKVGGAAENKGADEVLEKMRPYLKEVGESSHVIDYLVSYFDYPAKRTQALDRESRSNRNAPDKYKFLHTVIADIMLRYDIGNAEDFFKKTNMSYSALLPKPKRCLLLEAPVVASISAPDRKKAKELLDNYLSDAGHYLTKSRLNTQVDEFLQFNRVFKYKSDKVDWPLDKLKSIAAKSPDKVFELDLLGLRAAAWDWAQAHGSGDKDTQLIKQLKRDIEKLKLLRDYPTLYISDVRTVDELANRLQLAAEGLGRRSRSNFAADLERERAELRRVAAERRERDERSARMSSDAARQTAERERAAAQREKEAEVARRREAEAREAERETQRLRAEQEREREEDARLAATSATANTMSDDAYMAAMKRYY